MLFSSLPQELQDKLNSEGVFVCQKSSAVETEGQILASICFANQESADLYMAEHGFVPSNAAEAFEFDTKAMSDEEALRFAENEAASL